MLNKMTSIGALILGLSFPFHAMAESGQYVCNKTSADAGSVAAELNAMGCDVNKPVAVTVSDSTTQNTVDQYLICCVSK